MRRIGFDRLTVWLAAAVVVGLCGWQLVGRATAVDEIGDGSWVVEREMGADVMWSADIGGAIDIGISIAGDDQRNLTDVRIAIRNRGSFVQPLDALLGLTLQGIENTTDGSGWRYYANSSPHLLHPESQALSHNYAHLIIPPSSTSILTLDFTHDTLRWTRQRQTGRKQTAPFSRSIELTVLYAYLLWMGSDSHRDTFPASSVAKRLDDSARATESILELFPSSDH